MFCSICGSFMRLGTWSVSSTSKMGIGPHSTGYFCSKCHEEYKDHFVSSRLLKVVVNAKEGR